MSGRQPYKKWSRGGQLHREDGPAVECPDGTKEWWFNGQLHREDGPAVELADGTKEWWVNDQRHRVDGPAVERANGTKEWYRNGQQYVPEVTEKVRHAKKISGNTIKFYNTEDKYYRVEVRQRKDGEHYKFKVYVSDPKYENKIRDIITCMRIRDIMNSHEWTKMTFKNTGGKTFTIEDIRQMFQ